jgi:hypothetical protein
LFGSQWIVGVDVHILARHKTGRNRRAKHGLVSEEDRIDSLDVVEVGAEERVLLKVAIVTGLVLVKARVGAGGLEVVDGRQRLAIDARQGGW